MRALISIYCSLTLTLWSQLIYAHGEDKPGPRGGFIQMPGAFHTELVPINNNQFQMFLLDMNWQNPTTKKSSLSIKYSGAQERTVTCTQKSDHFLCQLPKDIVLNKKGKLFVAAEREGQKGISITYELPLKLPKAKHDHSGHH